MNPLSNLIHVPMHHFYLVEGGIDSTYSYLLEFLKINNIERENIALDEVYESIGVGEVSTIQEHHSERGSNIGKKIILVRTKSINEVAEHALLKVCEEPTEDTIIFILIPSLSSVRGTLRSRAHIVRMPSVVSAYDKVAVEFIKVNKNERMEMIAEIIAKHKDNDTSAPLRDEARELVDALLTLSHKVYKFPYGSNDKEKLNHLIQAHKYLSTSGASVKMILEHLALML